MSVSVFIRKFGNMVAALGLAVGVSALFFWFFTTAFTIRTIEVAGNGVKLTVDPRRLPRNLLLLSTEKLAAELRSEYPLLSSVTVSKRYPHMLVIAAITRKPIAQIVTPLGTFLIDADGIVVGEKTGADQFPRLQFAVSSIETGMRILDPAIGVGLQFLSRAKPFVDIEEISMNDSTSLLAKTPTIDIIFAQGGDIATIVATLQRLFEGFRIKGTLPTRIDLRFDKPVVTF